MQLLFLGTSASEGYPNAFCDCENCAAARQEGGASLRKRCSVLLDGQLLIDMGPDLMAAAQQHNLSLAQIRYCLQTHEHHDHLDPAHFASRSAYCGVFGTPRLQWYASSGAIARVEAGLGNRARGRSLTDPDVAERLNLSVHPVEPFQQWQMGPYTVWSVAAKHAPGLTAMLYVIERDQRVLFYCTDTSDLPVETWDALAATGHKIHVVVMDHTFGLRDEDSSGHMTSAQFCAQIARMQELGLLADGARFYAQHIAHHSNPPHSQLVAYASARGYDVAHDGLEITI